MNLTKTITKKTTLATEIISEKIRKIYHLKKRKYLKNDCPTIISINCIAGIIYHDLGLKFYSPTINLAMDAPDFITFVENLNAFLIHGELMQVFLNDCNYPVGELRVGQLSVKIRFIHYKSFEEAKLKWFQRAKRVNYDNLFIIWEVANDGGPDLELWNRFKALKHENKILITGNQSNIKNKHIFNTNIYKTGYFSGKILTYKKPLFYKRHLDDFDYIKFLNGDYFK